jgi:L-asparaginase
MKIAILYSGGTIGSIGTPLSPMNRDVFVKAFDRYILPIVHTELSELVVEFLAYDTTIDSTDIVPLDWCDMMDSIVDSYHDYDGFVLLHGTDTMSYTASMLSHIFARVEGVDVSKPIVLTGSQLPLFVGDDVDGLKIRYRTDALNNILGAITTIAHSINGVSIFFDNILLRGDKAIKIDSGSYSAFVTPSYPLLATYGIEYNILQPNTDNSTIDIDNLKIELNHIKANIQNINIVELVANPANPNTLSKSIESYIEQKVDGIILSSYGAGNFPSGNGMLIESLSKAIVNGIIVLNSSQVMRANVDSSIYSAGSWLGDIGVCDTHDMTKEAIYTKLMYLLSLRDYKKLDNSEIKKLILK